MKVIVLHDSRGKIMSVARIESPAKGTEAKTGAAVVPRARQSVLELELTGDLASQSLAEIHERWRVDPKAKRLVRRSKG